MLSPPTIYQLEEPFSQSVTLRTVHTSCKISKTSWLPPDHSPLEALEGLELSLP